MIFFYIICILSIFLVIFIYFKFSKPKKLSEEKIKYFKELTKKNLQLESEKEKIINFDKIYHKILLELKYN